MLVGWRLAVGPWFRVLPLSFFGALAGGALDFFRAFLLCPGAGLFLQGAVMGFDGGLLFFFGVGAHLGGLIHFAFGFKSGGLFHGCSVELHHFLVEARGFLELMMAGGVVAMRRWRRGFLSAGESGDGRGAGKQEEESRFFHGGSGVAC